jgi:DNA primase
VRKNKSRKGSDGMHVYSKVEEKIEWMMVERKTKYHQNLPEQLCPL